MLNKVSDRVYADVSGRNGGNFGFVVLDDRIVFIDSGMIHTCTAKVREWASKEFNRPVTSLIYTHSHSDHVFGAQGLGNVFCIGSLQMSDICLKNLKDRWTSKSILEYVAPRKEQQPELWESVHTLKIRLPDIIFEHRMIMGPSRDLTVMHYGGHTAGSSIVAVEPEHILFIGDLVFNGTFPYAGDPTCDPDQWILALEEIIDANYDIIIPGHGPICDNKELKSHVTFLTDLRENVKDALARQITKEKFLEQGLLPSFYEEGLEQRGPMTIEHFYRFYG